MRAPSRAVRLLLGVTGVLLAISLALTTPWVRVALLARATAWASSRFGVEIRAARLDYRLTSLSFTLQDVTVADRAAIGQPFFRADQVEIDLARSALRGRLDIDRIHLRRPRVVIDSTTRPGSRAGAAPASTIEPVATPPFVIGSVEVDGLDVTAGDSQGTRIELRQVNSTLHGRGQRLLEGDLTALGGVHLSFPTDDVRVAFDRAQARVALDATRGLVTGSLTATSPVAGLRAEGNVRLDGEGRFDLRYDAAARLEQLGRWWPDAPAWRGPVTLEGEVRGPLARPEATIAAKGTSLRWRSLQDAALDASALVSVDGLALNALRFTFPRGTLEGRGRLSFSSEGRGELTARWSDIDGLMVTDLLALAANEVPRGRLSGSATLAWPGRLPTVSTAEGKVDAAATAVAPETGATATLAAMGRAGRWQVNVRPSLDGLRRASLDGVVVADRDHLAMSPVSGSIVLEADNPRATLAQLQRLGVPLPQAVSAMDAGLIGMEGALTGSLGDPRVTGHVGVQGGRVGEVRDINVLGRAAIDTRALTVSTLAIHTSAGEVILDGVLPWSGTTGRGTIVAHLGEIAELGVGLPRMWRPAGPLEMSGEWSGSAQSPAVTAHFSGPGIGLNGLLLDSLSGDVSFADGVVTVTDMKATQPGGTFSASGSWRRDDSSLTATVRARGLAMSLVTQGATGSSDVGRLTDISLDADLSGSLARPDGVVSVEVGSATFRTGEPASTGLHELAFSGLSARVEATDGVAHMTASAATEGVTVDGRVTLGGPWPFAGRVSLTGSDAAKLARIAGVAGEYIEDLSASADATVEVSGTGQDPAGINADITLTRLDGQLRGRPLSLTGPGRTRLDAGVVTIVEPTRMTIGETALALAPSPAANTGADLVMTVDGPIDDFMTLAPGLVPEGITAEGNLKARVILGPRLDTFQPTGQATLELATVHRREQELASGVTVVANAAAGTVNVTDFAGTVLGSPLEGRATIPMAWLRKDTAAGGSADPASFSVRSRIAVAPVLAALMDAPPPDLSGTLNLTIDGTASAPRLDAVRARLQEQGGELTVGNIKLNTQRTTTLRLEDGLVHVDAFEWTGPQSTIVASGSVGVLEGTAGRLHLDGTASMGLLNLVVPARVGGRSTFDVEVTGPRGARELQGTIAIEDGSMVVQPWRLAMADWSGSLIIDAAGITVRGLHGQFNGGEATIAGRLPVGRHAANGDALGITLRSAFLDLPRGLRSQLDADLSWSREAGSPRLSGRATLTARTYREPVTELARLAALLIDRSGGSPMAVPAPLASTTLDVQLGTVGPLSMVNSVARVELLPEVQLVGTLARPALNGQIAVADDGRIQVSGRQYRLRDSRIEFRPERGMMPRLDVTGNTRVGDYTVYLRLTGAANEIETSLISDPPLGERDLQTLLVTGQRESLGGNGDSDQMAVGAVSGDVLGFAGQFLGFDSVVVGTTDDLALVSSDVDPALRLTVSKRLGNRFELVLSDNLDDNELTWVIIYRPRPGFELRAISRGSSEFTGEFRQEIPFGPGVSPPRIAARRTAARDRIVEVAVSGDPGLATSDVLAATSLKTGDHFDFGRWVDDRERITGRYLERGYFSARIVPTRRAVRSAGTEPQVALDYRITRGPRTVLTVAGYDPPAALLAQLRQAWSDSVLVDLLAADLEQVARNHLADLGYLRAAVKVDVDRTTPDQLTAALRIEPGPITTERHLAFSGNTVISEKDLQDIARAAGLDLAAWKNPRPLLETVEAAYAARGYLAAKATAAAIAFAGDAATLPVQLVEGPVARVATLAVSGVGPEGQAEAIAATGVSVGSTYVAGGEQALRAAMERHYRNLGHRDASVETETRVNAAEGRVDIVARVHPGPRYVVQSVRTTGVESTRDALVERATNIEAGSPASPAVAESTRRQLYDIGTFRSAEVTFEPSPAAPPTAETVPVDAVVSVQESRRFLFLYGLEATNQYESLFDKRISSGGVAADLRDRNFLGRGWTLGAGLRYEPSFQSGRVLMSVPRIRSKRIRTNIYVDSRTEDRARTEDVIFRDDETALTIEQRWRMKAPVELSWGYRYNYRDIRFLAAGTEQTLVRFNGNLAGLAGALVVDRRDNMFDAKKGWLFSTSAEWGLQAVGSDFDYLRTLVRASFYRPLGPFTLASNARWGNLQSFGGQPPISVLDLFYQAGGTQTVRGYKQDSLSAYTLLDSPVGGSKLVVFNQEIRFPLFWLLSGVAFADAGNTFTQEANIALTDLAIGVGFGLRIRTPLAPIRIDLGFPKYGNPTGSTAARWHFSIGQIF